MDAIKFVENDLGGSQSTTDFKAGDTVTVFYKIKEGDKERVQQYQGTVIQVRNSGAGKTFTVRKMSGNIGVERIFPLSSPFIDKIELNKKGSVRRARIFYIRERTGKAARIKEKKRAAVTA
jgi:large subunit ribosomal protein L19